ncbi:hypothetical protein L0M19_27310 [Streptomyces indiaensis]|nr:hypothetical protein [Streptomyces indiaensis]MCF1648888.1 hypothetical protein [Streptomyces indiaensis]
MEDHFSGTLQIQGDAVRRQRGPDVLVRQRREPNIQVDPVDLCSGKPLPLRVVGSTPCAHPRDAQGYCRSHLLYRSVAESEPFATNVVGAEEAVQLRLQILVTLECCYERQRDRRSPLVKPEAFLRGFTETDLHGA